MSTIYDDLRKMTELIITGLECTKDPQSNKEFIELLDTFSCKQIEHNKSLIANKQSEVN